MHRQILSTATALALTIGGASAQEYGGHNNVPPEQSVDSSTAEEFDIGGAIQTLGAEFCMDGDEVKLEGCDVPTEAYFDPRQTVREARAWTMDQLLRANAEETATLARTRVLRLQVAEENLRAELLQLQQNSSVVYSADELTQVVVDLKSFDHGLMAVEDGLAMTNELNTRLEFLETEYTSLANTVYNWCVTTADTDLCQALGLPE